MPPLRPFLIASVSLVAGITAACTYRVDSLADARDADPGDFVCARVPQGGETSANEGLCTLRAAIEEANATIVRDRIEIPPGTYSLLLPFSFGGGRLEITEDVTIQGSGPGAVIIEAMQPDSVFLIDGADATINQLTIQGGDSSAGGGLFINSGDVEMTDVVVRDNKVITGGGGIYVKSDAKLRLTRAAIRENFADGAFGGGLWNQGELRVFDSEITDNESNRAGGIRNEGLLNLRNVTVSGNEVHPTSSAGTGGISQTDFAFLNNVTITNNTGVGDDPISFLGGGIKTSVGATTVVKNSIIAENDGGGGPNDCAGPLTPDSRYNLIGDTSECDLPAVTTTWVLDTDPQLNTLGNFGGPTRSHRPFGTSPALGAGFPFPPGGPAADSCEGADQRGVPRPQGFSGTCDMGAVEETDNSTFVAGFVLVDADSDADIRPLLDGDRLILDSLPTSLTIRAAFNGVTPGSVRFDYDENIDVQTENVQPFAIGGDSAGDFNAFALAEGDHILTATPFSGDGATGAAGGSLTIHLEVID